jgi:(E)-4-hydroxy-3-methyl-but-2-enyl pyrophosphate reductase
MKPMSITINIDPLAGFCPGVTKAIAVADDLLQDGGNVYSFGELVHCDEELKRLEVKGLHVMSTADIDKVHHSKILIRAHGVSPDVQHKLQISNNEVVDATCNIVRLLQRKVKLSSLQMKDVGGQVVIFGKRKHPEVEGLVGYSQCRTLIIEKADDFTGIDMLKPMCIFAQTTTNVQDYDTFVFNVIQKVKDAGGNLHDVQVFNTICGSIKARVPMLKAFAFDHDVVIFVSGEESSNGAYLTAICKEENDNTYRVSSEDQLNIEWFVNAKNIGITGAASTPVWLLKRVSEKLNQLLCS